MSPLPAGWPAELDASFLPAAPGTAELPELHAANAAGSPPFSLGQGICISGGGSRTSMARISCPGRCARRSISP